MSENQCKPNRDHFGRKKNDEGGPCQWLRRISAEHKSSQFLLTNHGSTSQQIITFFSVEKVYDGVWCFKWKAGNGQIYATTSVTGTADLKVNGQCIFAEIETFGFKSYGSQQLPIGTNIYTIKGVAL